MPPQRSGPSSPTMHTGTKAGCSAARRCSSRRQAEKLGCASPWRTQKARTVKPLACQLWIRRRHCSMGRAACAGSKQFLPTGKNNYPVADHWSRGYFTGR